MASSHAFYFYVCAGSYSRNADNSTSTAQGKFFFSAWHFHEGKILKVEYWLRPHICCKNNCFFFDKFFYEHLKRNEGKRAKFLRNFDMGKVLLFQNRSWMINSGNHGTWWRVSFLYVLFHILLSIWNVHILIAACVA